MQLHALPGRLALGVVVCLGVAGIAASYAAGPDEIVAERRAGFKHVGENAKAMKDAIESGADVTPLAAKAQEIADWGKRIPDEFPVGSETAGGTHALPTVWSDRADFDKRAGDLVVEATLLAQKAESGDKDAFAAQFKATGAVCGGCHRTYRAKL